VQRDSLPNRRKVIWLGGKELQIAIAEGGGHIAALRLPGLNESANPYWQPPWLSLEPSAVTQTILDQEYGGAPEGWLLPSILGHSLALDLYGPPSGEEAAAGAVTRGQVGVRQWTWTPYASDGLLGECHDTLAQLWFSRCVHNRRSHSPVRRRLAVGRDALIRLAASWPATGIGDSLSAICGRNIFSPGWESGTRSTLAMPIRGIRWFPCELTNSGFRPILIRVTVCSAGHCFLTCQPI
jgi:hypothetical protein